MRRLQMLGKSEWTIYWKNMHPKRIEQYALFPYIAWTLVILFALYTGHLAMELKRTFDHLEKECTERNVCIEWKR
jgi:hypothetical protein